MASTVIVSLKQTVERLLGCSRPRISFPNSEESELKHILENLRSLKSFFDKISSLQDSGRFDELEIEIKDYLQNTQDLIDSHVSDLIHSGPEGSNPEFSEKLRKVNERIKSFTNTKEECYSKERQQTNKRSVAIDLVSSTIEDVGENKMIGMHEEEMKLKQRLLRESRHKIIPVVGMAGIGKTALAKQVLRDPIVVQKFPLRLFVSVGQQYQLRACLVHVLRGMDFRVEVFMRKGVEELGECVYQCLEGKRYLVVLDDIWDSAAWNELQQFFPDDNDESRIIWTTRMPDVIKRAGIGENAVEMGFLTAEASWDLLCQTVFPDSRCPYNLAEAGKKIVKKCEGLPLAIVEVGKHLHGKEKTSEYWTEASENVNSDIYQSISKHLSPTYKSLPLHLKPCFLYMGVFPTNYNIPTSQLIRLWIAEEFIDRYSCDSIEQRAEEYLEELVSRSLVMVHERSSRGRIKTCRIHFVYRNLCINEARNENLFHVINQHSNNGSSQRKNSQRRLCIHNDVLLGFKESRERIASCSSSRSLLCFGPLYQRPLRLSIDFPLLRVLHSCGIILCELSKPVLQLFQLRYIAVACDRELPLSIPNLGDLECLILHRNQRINPSSPPVYLPVEIWKLKKLRHLECMGFDLKDPSTVTTVDGVLEKLLTLSGVSAHSCTQAILSRMPNLIKLGIWFDPKCHGSQSFSDISNLPCLKSFKCISVNLGSNSPVLSPAISFPISLQKLTLRGCGFRWEHINIIAELPNLEVLKLQWYAFRGPRWEAHEGGFLRLKYLLLEDSDVQYWGSHSSQFPQLSSLIIRRCYQLEELPREFREILTLERIELVDCSPSAIAKATKIQDVQQELGNHVLQLKLVSALEDNHLHDEQNFQLSTGKNSNGLEVGTVAFPQFSGVQTRDEVH